MSGNARPGRRPVTLRVNGAGCEVYVEPRTSLADALRDELGLTGTHVGCEQGACGACTVLVDGESVRSCLMLAVQADGCGITTVEGLADGPIQRAFTERHALQCGFCTPGFLMSTAELLAERRGLSERDIRTALAGNLCRCTGYQGIIAAVRQADEACRNRPQSALSVDEACRSRPQSAFSVDEACRNRSQPVPSADEACRNGPQPALSADEQ